MSCPRLMMRLFRLGLWFCVGVLPLRAEFPEKPVVVIVPFAAGGGSDVFVRIIQKAIREGELSPKPFIVRNVGGAGGTMGSRQARDATPDGYTIMCLHDGIYTAQHYGNADWGPEDFEPIAATGRAGVVIAVAESSPHETLSALMDVVAAGPYEVVFGTNLGAPSHYSALFLQHGREGARFRFTQSGGGAKRLGQLKGGHIDVTSFSVSEYVQFREAGIRALAVLSEERVSALPELPTAREQGVEAIHSLMQFWWAPKGTPPDRVHYFADLLRRAMETDETQARLAQLHIEPVFHTGTELVAAIDERRAHLEGIAIEKPPPLPPLHWIVLGMVVCCSAWVWRENSAEGKP